jgi:hypothetical protein
MSNQEIYIYPTANETGELGAPFSIFDVGKFDPFKGVGNIISDAKKSVVSKPVIKVKLVKPSNVQKKQVTLIGLGTLKTYSEPSSFELKVSNELTALGWTVTGTSLKNKINFDDRTQWLRVASPILGYVAPTWNYSISISISALASHNSEEIKNRVANYLGQFFSDLKLAVAGQTFDNGAPQQQSTGVGNGSNNNNNPEGDSSFDKFMKSLGGSLGLSTPVIAVGIGVVVLIVLKR